MSLYVLDVPLLLVFLEVLELFLFAIVLLLEDLDALLLYLAEEPLLLAFDLPLSAVPIELLATLFLP